MLGDRTSSDSVPKPVDSPPAQAVIPAEFDLADGLPREPAGSGLDAPALEICGDTFSLAERATASQWAGYGERGDLSTRVLSVYPDADTARSVATDLIATFESCPRFSDGRALEWTTSVRPTAEGDQGWVLARFARGSGPRAELPEVIQIVRLGASLLVIQAREIHGVAPEDSDPDDQRPGRVAYAPPDVPAHRPGLRLALRSRRPAARWVGTMAARDVSRRTRGNRRHGVQRFRGVHHRRTRVRRRAALGIQTSW